MVLMSSLPAGCFRHVDQQLRCIPAKQVTYSLLPSKLSPLRDKPVITEMPGVSCEAPVTPTVAVHRLRAVSRRFCCSRK